MFWSKAKIIQETRRAVLAEVEQQRLEHEEHRKEIEVMCLSEHIGKLVICVSNEMDNVTVGYGKEITFITRALQPQLIVHDIVNDTEVMPFGIMFTYTEQKFDALNNMDHNARIALFFSRDSDRPVSKEATKSDNLYEPFEWNLKVKAAVDKWKTTRSIDRTNEIESFSSSYTPDLIL